jgi:tripartite-type tricarboxylate transporter receptor subunit TctC
MHKRKLLGLAWLGLACFGAQAQADYPNKPIRFVSISSPGSGGDTITRLMADKMAPLLNATFVVENKPGASGAIAADAVAKAPADGYTILLGGYTTHVLLPAIHPKLAYNSVKDFSPIGRIGTASILLVATNDFPASNLKEFIALARSKPQLQYASWGNGSTGHFCGELLSQRRQLHLSHVPYKGVAQILTDLLGGHIKLAFVDMASGSPMVKNGKLKALASCPSPTPNLPGVPSYDDEGVDFEGKRVTPPMWALYAPADTPKPVMDKLSGALKAVVEMPDVKARLLELGVVSSFLGGAEVRDGNAAGIEAWKQVAKTSNITLD